MRVERVKYELCMCESARVSSASELHRSRTNGRGVVVVCEVFCFVKRVGERDGMIQSAWSCSQPAVKGMKTRKYPGMKCKEVGLRKGHRVPG